VTVIRRGASGACRVHHLPRKSPSSRSMGEKGCTLCERFFSSCSLDASPKFAQSARCRVLFQLSHLRFPPESDSSSLLLSMLGITDMITLEGHRCQLQWLKLGKAPPCGHLRHLQHWGINCFHDVGVIVAEVQRPLLSRLDSCSSDECCRVVQVSPKNVCLGS